MKALSTYMNWSDSYSYCSVSITCCPFLSLLQVTRMTINLTSFGHCISQTVSQSEYDVTVGYDVLVGYDVTVGYDITVGSGVGTNQNYSSSLKYYGASIGSLVALIHQSGIIAVQQRSAGSLELYC